MYCNTLNDDELEMASKAPYYYSEIIPKPNVTVDNDKANGAKTDHYDKNHGFDNPLLSIEPDVSTGDTTESSFGFQKKKKKKKKNNPVTIYHRSNSLIQNGVHMFPSACYGRREVASSLDTTSSMPRKNTDLRHRRRSSEPNIYEEIPEVELVDDSVCYSGSVKGFPVAQKNQANKKDYDRSPGGYSSKVVLDEVAKVQKRHAQILENLNLDVEAMLMPEDTPCPEELLPEKEVSKSNDNSANSESKSTHVLSPGTPPLYFATSRWQGGGTLSKSETASLGRRVMNEYILQQSDFCPTASSPSSKGQGQECQKAAHQRFSDPICAGRPCDEPLYMLYDDSHRQQRASSRASVGFQSPEDNIYEEVDLQQLCRPDDDFEDSVSWFGSEAGADHSASSASEEMEEETGAAKLAAYIIGKKKKSKKNREQEGVGGGFTRWFSTRKKEYDLDKSSHRSSIRAQDDEGYVDVKISKKQRPPLSLPPIPSSLTPEKMKRRYIVGTIVESENSYINALQRLIRDYKHPLEDSNPPIVSPNKISLMFHRVEQILQCHNIFGIALTQCVKQWDQDEKIGDVFVASFSKAMVLDIYSDFINNFSLAMETAKQASKNKSAFADFLKVKQITSADRLSFFGLMVKPVQRFPQFILLLQDLLKHTPPGHHDRMSLQLALTQLESLAETLNERKRESEQHYAVKEVLKHIGKFSLKSFADRDHYLLRQDDIVQLQLDQNGLVVKSKNRRIFLLNGLLVSVSVTPRTSDGIQNGERLTLKWAVPLQHVEVQKDVAPATRNLMASSGRSRLSGSKCTERPSVDGGSVQTLYDELSDLVHDLEVMSRISALVSSLRCSYSGLTTELTQNLSQSIQESIRQKDKEITLLDSCCLQLAVPLKSRSNKEALCFQMVNPSVKRDWTTDFRLAKLALDPNNTPAWYIPDQEKRPSSKMPLFVKTFPVFQCASAAEVKCGCYYMVCSGSLQHPQQYLWLCSSDGINSHIVVMAIHLTHLCQVAAYHLNEMRILAMEAVPAMQSSDGCISTSDVTEEISRPADAAETVWLGTDSRKILVLEGSCPEKWEEIGSTTVTSSVIQIKYHWEQVFVALANGSVNIFQRDTDGKWKLAEPLVVSLDQEPVTCLLPLGLSMYCACGTKIWILDAFTTEIQKSYTVQHESEGHAYLLAHSGTGLWISLRNSATICLYHTETFRHLQDINVASNVNHLLAAKQQERPPRTISVTCLLASRGLLWVGTNVGIVLTVPLPRLEGVPIISGRTNVAYHGHHGQVSLLLSLQLRPVTSAIPTSASREEDSGNDQEGELSKRVVKQKSDSMLPSPASVKEANVFSHKASAADIHISGAKTLPRSMTFCPHTHPHNTMEDSSDVYGLYADLMNVQNYEEDSREKLYERLNHSDPELVHFHLTTLDRRLQQKTGRPRSWDLSAMAVSEDSDSSAAYDSASTATSTATADTSVPSPETCVNTEIGQSPAQPLVETSQSHTQVTLSRTAFKASRKSPFDSSQKTVLMLTGGCSYVNWRKSEKEKDTASSDSHVIIWEMKL